MALLLASQQSLLLTATLAATLPATLPATTLPATLPALAQQPTFSPPAVISLSLRNAAGFNALLPDVLYGQAAERGAEPGGPAAAPTPHWISATGLHWTPAPASTPDLVDGMQGTLLPMPGGAAGAYHDLGNLTSTFSPTDNGTRFTSRFTTTVTASSSDSGSPSVAVERDHSRNASVWLPFHIGAHLRSRVLFSGGVVTLPGGGFLKSVTISCHEAGSTPAERSIGGVHAIASADGYEWTWAGTIANDTLIQSSEGANENGERDPCG